MCDLFEILSALVSLKLNSKISLLLLLLPPPPKNVK